MKNNDKVYINLDRPRELWFGIKAQKMLQSVYGISPEELVEQTVTLDLVVKVLYCALQRDAAAHGETLTEQQAEDLLDGVRPKKLLKKFTECINAAFADEDDEDAAPEHEGNPTAP